MARTVPTLPDDAKANRKVFGGWTRQTAAVLLPGIVQGRRPEVAERRKELAGQWAAAQRRGDEVGGAAAAALLALQDEALRYLAADEAVAVERDSVAARLLLAVAQSPGLQQTVLAKRVGVAAETVSREGGRMEDRGLVVRRRVGRQRLWELTPRGRAAVDRLSGPRLVPGAPPQQSLPAPDTPEHLDALAQVHKAKNAEKKERALEAVQDSPTGALFARTA